MDTTGADAATGSVITHVPRTSGKTGEEIDAHALALGVETLRGRLDEVAARFDAATGTTGERFAAALELVLAQARRPDPRPLLDLPGDWRDWPTETLRALAWVVGDLTVTGNREAYIGAFEQLLADQTRAARRLADAAATEPWPVYRPVITKRHGERVQLIFEVRDEPMPDWVLRGDRATADPSPRDA
jgi:hypothetical protein